MHTLFISGHGAVDHLLNRHSFHRKTGTVCRIQINSSRGVQQKMGDCATINRPFRGSTGQACVLAVRRLPTGRSTPQKRNLKLEVADIFDGFSMLTLTPPRGRYSSSSVERGNCTKITGGGRYARRSEIKAPSQSDHHRVRWLSAIHGISHCRQDN